MVERHNIDDVNATITITLSPEDYAPAYRNELNKFAQKAEVKGFRKGKVPVAYVTKLYGTSLLYDSVMKQVQSLLDNHIKENQLQIFGYPLGSKDQKPFKFLPNCSETFEFNFDIGISPQVTLADFKKHEFNYYECEVTNDFVNEEIKAIQEAYAEPMETKVVEAKSTIQFEAEELADGQILEGGVKSSFMSMATDFNLEEFGTDMADMAVGKSYDVNIYNIEKKLDKNHVKKYLLKTETECGEHFRLTISSIKNKVPVNFDQAVFDKMFGENVVNSEDEARNRIKESILASKATQSSALLFVDFRKYLSEKTEVNLPESFLIRYFNESREKGDKNPVTQSEINATLDHLKWTEIKRALAVEYPVEIKTEDIKQYFFNDIYRQFGQYTHYLGEKYIEDNIAKNMKDNDKVYHAHDVLETEKLFKLIEVDLLKKTIPLDRQSFDEKVNPKHDHTHDHEHDHEHDHDHDHAHQH